MRTERDALGERELPADALYGINTLRANENFALSHRPVHPSLVRAMVLVKKAAALAYASLGVKPEISRAIVAACDRALAGEAAEAFSTQALQGGAGTSMNMNVNEVLCNLALRELGEPCGRYDLIHPLDDVNRGQSTNDVFPTALRIAAILALRELSDECAALQTSLQRREQAFEGIRKLGRTELMDAVPITLGEEFGAYAQAIARDRWRLYKMEERLRQVNLGGTAVGTGANADRRYRFRVIETLRELTGIGLAAAEYPIDITQNNDVFVEVSGLLKALAVNLQKIAGDLRLMGMGPRGGLHELRLSAVQQGSTIMPGKVNPVMPEMAIQAGMRVMGNDAVISMAAAHGEFELNAFLPLIADALLESLHLLIPAVRLFRERCVDTLEADAERCGQLLNSSHAFATAYAPTLGYDVVSQILHECGEDAALARKRLAELAEQRRDG